MNLRSIKSINVKGKRVLLRVDFNVPVKNGRVEDDFRIKRTLPTIKLLKQKNAKIILISHITDGRTKSLRPMAKYLKIKFIPNLKVGRIKNGEVVLLENIRKYKGEEKNDKNFAKQLAGLADIYVNDAFSVSHRKHASLVGITKYLPSYIGLLFEEELENLKTAFRPPHPFLLILGGIKFESKLGVLKKFLRLADKIFIGGALSNNFFRLRGIDIKKSDFDPKINIKKYLNNKKIIFPVDVKWYKDKILDAGTKTIKMLEKEINKSKFVLWNGPLGDYEKGFIKTTFDVARAIAKSKAKSMIGGGDTVAVVNKIGILKKFSFVSTAGGAMLEFLAKGTLPGIKALERQ